MTRDLREKKFNSSRNCFNLWPVILSFHENRESNSGLLQTVLSESLIIILFLQYFYYSLTI